MKKLLVVDDERNMRWAIRKALEKDGYQIEEAADGWEALSLLERFTPHLILLDLKMPGMDGLTTLKKIKALQEEAVVIMLTAHGTMESAVEAMKSGATDYLSKPFDIDELKLVMEKALEMGALKKEVAYLREALESNQKRLIIGESPALKELMGAVDQVARTNASVLILGESGSGKELIANAIHERSHRREKSLIKVNCGAIPPTLIESELFGHEKGAFTGADTRRIGKFEQAHEGTIFLDEVGELELSMQVKLLRVLQEKEIERIGGSKPISVDVRVIAATNRDLEEMVGKGEFREDLYYRLNVIPLVVPPLRKRKGDIPILIDHFLQRFSGECGRGPMEITPDAVERLVAYSWKGNVRELENVMERMVILAKGPVIDSDQLPPEIYSPQLRTEFQLPEEGISLAALEKSLITQALQRTNFNQTHAAKLLDMSRHTLIYRMEKYEINSEEVSKGDK